MSIQNHFLSLLLLLDFLRLKIASGKGLCQPYSCLNGGICVEEETNFHCNCLLRFKGRYCQTRSSVCTEETCLNNGQCVENAGNFHCNCPEGFEGRQCEQTYSPATTVQTSGKQDDFVMEGKIIGSLVGGIIGVCLLAALVAYVWKKKNIPSNRLDLEVQLNLASKLKTMCMMKYQLTFLQVTQYGSIVDNMLQSWEIERNILE